MLFRRIALAAFVTLLFVASSQAQGDVCDYACLTILDSTNQERAAVGLSALCVNQNAMEASIDHSIDMNNNNFMSHTGSDGSSLSTRCSRTGYTGWSRLGENVASAPSATTAMSAWMQSSGHKANILGDFNHIGPSGRGYKFTQVFGKHSGQGCITLNRNCAAIATRPTNGGKGSCGTTTSHGSSCSITCNTGFQKNGANRLCTNTRLGGSAQTCSDRNECNLNTDNCHADATCTNTVGSFTCACKPGFTGNGVTCTPVSDCNTASNGPGGSGCINGGVCVDGTAGDGAFTCNCAGTGYTGANCQTDVNECTAGTDNCHATLATCTNTAGSFTCACNTGYTGNGVTCTDVNECTAGTDNCHAQATCTNTAGSFTCACNSGFSGNGVTCTDINECTAGTDNCHATLATCTNTPGSFTCACNAGYTGNGVTCTDINECTAGTDNCAATATCSNTPGSFTCACNTGYTGNGVTCTDINECTAGTDNCAATATCSNTPGSFTCACNTGYTGNGVTCTDINECTAGTDNCAATATCSNTPGSFTCACNTGYTGNGVTCTDINECTAGTDNCAATATCSNTPGSFTCACNTGYSGNGVTCTALSGDCTVAANGPGGVACQNGGACVDGTQFDNAFTCNCAGTGYTGSNCQTDVNECTAGTDNCHTTLATCANTPGSFTCACVTGYSGNGVTCTDINECTAGTDNCHATLATCTNTPGSFTCACNTGYSGNGVTCTPVPTTASPTTPPTTASPTTASPTSTVPTSAQPTTGSPTTASPTTAVPTTGSPTTTSPTTASPTTATPTTAAPTTALPTTAAPSPCQAYCSQMAVTCASQVFSPDCATACAGFPLGTQGDASGNSLACRAQHLSLAVTGVPATHCPHASQSGGGVCVDATTTAAPTSATPTTAPAPTTASPTTTTAPTTSPLVCPDLAVGLPAGVLLNRAAPFTAGQLVMVSCAATDRLPNGVASLSCLGASMMWDRAVPACMRASRLDTTLAVAFAAFNAAAFEADVATVLNVPMSQVKVVRTAPVATATGQTTVSFLLTVPDGTLTVDQKLPGELAAEYLALVSDTGSSLYDPARATTSQTTTGTTQVTGGQAAMGTEGGDTVFGVDKAMAVLFGGGAALILLIVMVICCRRHCRSKDDWAASRRQMGGSGGDDEFARNPSYGLSVEMDEFSREGNW